MDGDRLTGFVAGVEIFPFQHPRNRVLGGHLDEFGGAHGIHPSGIELDLGFLRVENFIYLLLVGFAVFDDLLPR